MASRTIEVQIVGDAKSLEGAFGRAATASQKFQRGLAPVARGAKIALAGIAGLGIASVKLANDFNRTSSQMVGLAGVGSKQVEEWKKAVLELAPVVGQVPDELAKSLYFIASSGVPASKALDTLKISAMGATAGLGETEVVADAVTSAMNAYADVNLTAAQAADVLTATVREGKGEAAAIAPVLGNILPVASQLGIGFNEVGAAMASMTRLGFDAATSATNLTGVLSSILKPSAQAEEGFKDVGTSSEELQKSLDQRGLLATLQDLSDRFKGNNSAIAKSFGNIRALRGVLALVGKSADDTAGVFKNLEDNTGDLGHAFKAAAETDSFKLQQSFAKIQAAGIKLGSTIAPAVGSMADALSGAADAAGRHTTATKATLGAVAALSGVIIVANTGLKIYNSALIAATIGQERMLVSAELLGPALLFGGVLVGTIALLGVLSDTGDKLAEAFDRATAAANDYRGALTTLNSSAEDIKDNELQVEQSEVSLAAARRNLKDVTKQYGKGSLEARQATAQLHQAERDLEKSEAALHKSRQKNSDSQRKLTADLIAAKKGTFDLRKEVLNLDNRTTNASLKAKIFADRMHDLSTEYGGAETKAGRAAQAVADLTTKLHHVPTLIEINLVLNANHAYDQIEALRARAGASITVPVYTTSSHAPPKAAGGPVRAGMPYIVGERRPELFVPDRSGRILPRVPSSSNGHASQPAVINLLLDRKVLASVLVDLDRDHRRRNGGRPLFA